jgi:hypothetical protein
MKSSIKIDFIDRGTGKGIEPVIRVDLKSSEDPRDTLLQTLFQSVSNQEYLQFRYYNQKHVTTVEGYPDMEKQVLLFKPEKDTSEITSALHTCFLEWIDTEGWKPVDEPHMIGTQWNYEKGSERKLENELLSDFMSIKASHHD